MLGLLNAGTLVWWSAPCWSLASSNLRLCVMPLDSVAILEVAILLHQFPGQGIKPVIRLPLAPRENKMQCKETCHFPALRPWESHSAWPWVGFEMIGTRRLVALFDELFIVWRLFSWLLPEVRGNGLYEYMLSYCFTLPHHSIGAAFCSGRGEVNNTYVTA